MDAVRFSGIRTYNGDPVRVTARVREAEEADPLALTFYAKHEGPVPEGVGVVLDGKDRNAAMWLYPKYLKTPDQPLDSLTLSQIPKNPMPNSKPGHKQHAGFLKRLEQMRADFVGRGQVMADYLGSREDNPLSMDGTPAVEENFDEPVDVQKPPVVAGSIPEALAVSA